jgi:hypothetical protein
MGGTHWPRAPRETQLVQHLPLLSMTGQPETRDAGLHARLPSQVVCCEQCAVMDSEGFAVPRGFV